MAAPVKRLPDVHGLSLFKSSKLSGLYVPHFIQPEEVIRALNAAKVSFTLVGAHGLGGGKEIVEMARRVRAGEKLIL